MAMNSKLNVILGVLGGFLISVFFNGFLETRVLANRTIEFENTPLPQSKLWSLVEKMDEKDDLLKTLPLNIATKSLGFYENRFAQNGTVSRKRLTEQNKDIGMKIMNTDTGEIQVIKVYVRVEKSGVRLIGPPGYQIDIVERASGIRWNRWNTLYKIANPQGWLVLKNKYPDVTEKTQKIIIKDKTGKKRTISKKLFTVEEFIYSPYSGELHTPELIAAGRQYLKSAVKDSLIDLKEKQVYSRVLPGVLVADISALTPSFFEHLPLLEHTDMTEFTGDSQKSVERVLVLIGANKDVAFKKTGSKAGALGWVQYTPKTYDTIRKTYPETNLTADFEAGAADHLNSMKAAILLYDYNLSDLMRKHGNSILGDSRLEEYLAAAYNGKPSRASLSLKASIANNASDWIYALSAQRGGLANETKSYMTKIRYLQEKGLP